MKRLGAVAATLALALGLGACGDDEQTAGGGGAEDGGKIRVALGDIESVETLALFIAMERVRKRGTDVELIELADEDLANQAVIGGQADVGLGAPYGLIEGSGAPLRIFCQLQSLKFFPVVDKAAYPDWQSLDGETIAVHSRGSTSEALAHIIEQEEGIEFGKVSFVPGAEVRATALLRGNVKAAVLDIPNKNYVMAEEPGKFADLPTPETSASDEVLFANTAVGRGRTRRPCRSCSRRCSPSGARSTRTPRSSRRSASASGCSRTCRPSSTSSSSPTTRRGRRSGLFTQDCGGEAAAQDDFEFYHAAGQLKGDPASLKVEDFWSLEPLKAAVARGQGIGQLRWPRRSRAARPPAAWRPGASRREQATLGCCASGRSWWCSACGSGPARVSVNPAFPTCSDTLVAFWRDADGRDVRRRLRRDRRPAHRRRAAHRRRRRARRAGHGAVGAGGVARACPSSSSCRPRRRRRSSR